MHAFLCLELDRGVGPGGRGDLANGAEPASLPPAHRSAAERPFPRPLRPSAWLSALRCRGCWLGCKQITQKSLSYT